MDMELKSGSKPTLNEGQSAGMSCRAEVLMESVRSVLMVHDEPDAFRGLEALLKGQGVFTSHARRCAGVPRALRQPHAIDVVLTDVAVGDGTWKDVIRLVRKQAQNIPVIVMSRVVSMQLYLDTQDGGAADFIVPPMSPRDLEYALTTAMHRRPPAGMAGAPAPGRSDQRSQPRI